AASTEEGRKTLTELNRGLAAPHVKARVVSGDGVRVLERGEVPVARRATTERERKASGDPEASLVQKIKVFPPPTPVKILSPETRLTRPIQGGTDLPVPPVDSKNALAVNSIQVELAGLTTPGGLSRYREKTLQSARSVEASTAAVSQLAQAVETPEGRVVSTRLFSAVSKDAGASSALVQVQSQASRSTQGLTALTLLNQGIVRDPKLALAVAQVHAQAATLGPGRIALGQAASNLNESHAAGAVKIEAQVIATPEGRAALAHLNVSLSKDPIAAKHIQAMRVRAREENEQSAMLIQSAASKDPILANSIEQLAASALQVSVKQVAQVEPKSGSQAELDDSIRMKSASVGSEETLLGRAFEPLIQQEAHLNFKETVVTESSQEGETIEEISKPKPRTHEVEPPMSSKAKNFEEVQPVSLFEPGDRTGHNCRRCGTDFQARVACCPSCQDELRQILATNSTSFQRAGFVISRQSDRVEVSRHALEALNQENSFVQLRGATVFVQMRDLLAACQQKTTGYATIAPRKSARPNLD
ncbi:hypothetical protein JST97_04665, partial [bacterium]|nr:hypothetical protein [bacterium]